MANKYDIAVAYRIYPGVSKTPPIFADDKYSLSELCLRSFKKSLSGVKIKLYVLLDNCPVEYEALFKKYFGEEDGLELVRLAGIGNNGTFKKQVDLLSLQNFSDIIYFAEDDYFYLPGAFSEMLDLIKNKRADFVTPYAHLDYYSHELHKYNSEEIRTQNRIWKSVSTTTMTFMADKKAFNNNKKIFLSYSDRNDDASLWLSLTKKRIFNPLLYYKFLLNDKAMFKVMAKMWYFGWIQALFGKKRKLWAPDPTLATHMDSEYLAPGFDWETTFRTQK